MTSSTLAEGSFFQKMILDDLRGVGASRIWPDDLTGGVVSFNFASLFIVIFTQPLLR